MRFPTNFLLSASLLASSLHAQSQSLFFNTSPTNIQVNIPYIITYTSTAKFQGAVTILLRKGDPKSLQTIATLTSSATGSSYVWVPSNSLATASDYALQIIQGDESNYSTEFSVMNGEPSTDATNSIPTITSSIGKMYISPSASIPTTSCKSEATLSNQATSLQSYDPTSVLISTSTPTTASVKPFVTTLISPISNQQQQTATIPKSLLSSVKSQLSAYKASLAYYTIRSTNNVPPIPTAISTSTSTTYSNSTTDASPSPSSTTRTITTTSHSIPLGTVVDAGNPIAHNTTFAYVTMPLVTRTTTLAYTSTGYSTGSGGSSSGAGRGRLVSSGLVAVLLVFEVGRWFV